MNAARLTAALAGTFLFLTIGTAAPVGWRMDNMGVYPDAQPPTEWSASKNVLWKTKLPGNSYGSPILVGDGLFLVSDPVELIRINPADGAIVWQRSQTLESLYGQETAATVTAEFQKVKAERDRLRREHDKAKDDPEKKAEIKKALEAVEQEWKALAQKHPLPPSLGGDRGATNSAATPACDGETIYAIFGNGIVCAYSLDGEKRWAKFVEPSTLGFGHSASPVLVDGKLLVHLQDLVALDPKTGKEIWRAKLGPQHATPVVTKVGDTPVVIDPSGAVVRASDGKVMLKHGNLAHSECTPLVQDGIVYTTQGKARALKLVPDGADKVKLEQLWEGKIAGDRRTPSAVLHDGLLYVVSTGGRLDVLDARTGESVYQQRLNLGDLYGSLTLAGKYLFAGSTKGTSILFETGREFKEVARNPVESFGSCPVFQGQRMYLRSRQHLYCFGK